MNWLLVFDCYALPMGPCENFHSENDISTGQESSERVEKEIEERPQKAKRWTRPKKITLEKVEQKATGFVSFMGKNPTRSGRQKTFA